MSPSNVLSRQSRRLLQLALRSFCSRRSRVLPFHTSLSLNWGDPLTPYALYWVASRVAFWFLVYSGLAIVAAYMMAGIVGAGQSTIPLAGAALGSPLQENAIMVVAYSSAPTGIISFALILWGLRAVDSASGS